MKIGALNSCSPQAAKKTMLSFLCPRPPSRRYLSIYEEHRFLHQTSPEQSSRSNSWTDRLQIGFHVLFIPSKSWKPIESHANYALTLKDVSKIDEN